MKECRNLWEKLLHPISNFKILSKSTMIENYFGLMLISLWNWKKNGELKILGSLTQKIFKRMCNNIKALLTSWKSIEAPWANNLSKIEFLNLMKIELNRLWFWCPLLQPLQTNIWKISTGKRSLKSWTNHSKQISTSVWLNCFRTRSKRKQNRLNRFLQEQVGKKKSKINWSKLKRSGTNSTSLWILIGRARTSSSSAQWKTSCRLLMTISSKYNPWWDRGMLVKSGNKSRYLRKDSCLFLKS